MRWLIASPLAACITFGLFYGMQALIAMREGEVDPAPSGKLVGFVRVKREAAPPPDDDFTPERPPSMEAPPSNAPTPDLGKAKALGSAGPLDIAAPKLDTSIKMAQGATTGTAVGDTDAVPLLRVEPRYPPRLLRDRVEGWVRMRFSIDRSGKTKHVVVVDSKPAVVFDEAALAAVRRWKYQPKAVDGQTVERHGLTVRLSFKVPDE